MDTNQTEGRINGDYADAMNSSHNASISMNDIIYSMRGHLLDQHAHADPGFGSQCIRSSNLKCNKENVHPAMDDKMKQRNISGDEEWFDDILPQNKVPPLSLGDPGEDSETEIELNTPRLNNPLFQKLKKKYPRAFRRRSSAFSDTSSVCSLSLPGTPRTPRRLSFPLQTANNEDNRVNSEETQNSNLDKSFDKGGFGHSIEDFSGITHSRNGRSIFDRSKKEDYTMIASNSDRSRSRPVTPKRTDEKASVETDSKLSLKERLHRNKKNLRELLDEKYPFKSRSLSVFTASPNNTSYNDDKSKSYTSRTTNDISANRAPSYCASKPPKPTHTASKRLTNGNLSLHDIEHKTGADSLRQGRTGQKRLVTDQYDQKLAHSKRFSSPDSGGSTHDSAVDVDSASIQSSPSSSDHSPNQAATVTQHTSHPNTPTHQSLPPRPGRYAPKLKSRRSAQAAADTDHHLSYSRDSDTDSGIGAHGHYLAKQRDRNDSGSSGDIEDLHGGIFSGRKLSPESMRDLRISGNRGHTSNNNNPRQGPVKADHAIHTPSPVHKAYRDDADEEVEMWYKHGARPKVFGELTRRAASAADLSRKRESPSRVHFNDDIDYSDQLRPWHRTTSQPDLLSNGAGRFHFSIASGNENHNGASHERESSVDLHGPGRPSSPEQNDVDWDNISQSNYSTASGPELAHEIGYYSKLYEDINNTGKTKKSKRPWKRNKAKFTPSDDDERVFSNLVKARSVSNIVQSTEYSHRTDRLDSAQSGVYENIPALEGLNNTYENLPSTATNSDDDNQNENPYEEVPHVKNKTPPAKPPRPQKTPEHENANRDLYASVDRRTTDTKRKMYSSNPCVAQLVDESINIEEGPPVPARGYTSDLEKYKELSGSRSSLSERVGSMKKSAKKGLTKLRRAMSLEKIDKEDDSDGQGQLKKSSSIHSLKEKLSFKRKGSDGSSTKQRPSSAKSKRPPRSTTSNKISKKHSFSMTALDKVDSSPTHFRPIGKLLQLNPDGTQLVELNKPPHGPFGFYIARGNAKYNHGIFISRLSDSLPASFFASLLGVGDEILEINQEEVRSLTMEQLHELMASTNRLILKTLPFLARKDVT